MCRLLAYLGQPTLVHDILYKPENSLVQQSKHALESKFVVNGDGFGFGWYDPRLPQTPGLFRSIQPAWNDINLRYLTEKIITPCCISHIRAATAGGVSKMNCHPFHYGKWLLAHNGNIGDFSKIKRHLRHLLADPIYDWVNGQTDSQHIMALWLQHLSEDKQADHKNALLKTLATLQRLLNEQDSTAVMHINVVLTNGRTLLALRYTNQPKSPAPSLYYTHGQLNTDNDAQHIMLQSNAPKSILVASEKMDSQSDWQQIRQNTLLQIDQNIEIAIHKLD